jgi:hypothetical protein
MATNLRIFPASNRYPDYHAIFSPIAASISVCGCTREPTGLQSDAISNARRYAGGTWRAFCARLNATLAI